MQSLTWQSRELLNIALAKNKIGETMVLKFVSFSKARRSLESRRRSCGDRKVDLLGRKGGTTHPFIFNLNIQVMKHQTKHFDTTSGSVHLPAAEKVGHRAPHQVASGSHYTCLDILAWYFCLKQALVFSNCWRGVDVARMASICGRLLFLDRPKWSLLISKKSQNIFTLESCRR